MSLSDIKCKHCSWYGTAEQVEAHAANMHGEVFRVSAKPKIVGDVWPQWFNLDEVGELRADDVVRLHFAAIEAGLHEPWFRMLAEIQRLRVTSDQAANLTPPKGDTDV